jgi:long-chain fatty acid transport protein
MRRLRALALLLALTSPARASTPEVLGLGSEESALAGASAARVHDFSAGYYDPAGLTQLERPEVSLGFVGWGSALTIKTLGAERRQDLSNPMSVLLGAATPVPFGGWLERRIYVGLALGIVPGTLAHIVAHRADEPFYPLYDRTQRLVVLPSIAARLPWGLSLGLAFNYLAGFGGRLDAQPGPTGALEPRADLALTSQLAVNAGLRWQATRWLALAIVYRQQFSIPFHAVSRNQVAGQAIDLDVDADGLFTPHELVAGWALKLPFRVTASLDLQWSHWSAYRGPFVAASGQLPVAGAVAVTPPQVGFDDTFGVRGGLELVAVEKKYSSLTLRGGYGFETAAVSADQPGVTNLLDGNKHRLCAGGGLRFEFAGLHIRGDIHGQLDIVQPQTLTKKVAAPGDPPDPARALGDEVPDDPARPSTLGTQISNPGYPQVSSGGLVWALGFTITVEGR